MGFILYWYLLGAISGLAAEYYFEKNITLGSLVIGLTVCGILGPIITIIAIVAVISEARDTKEWNNFWNQKIF